MKIKNSIREIKKAKMPPCTRCVHSRFKGFDHVTILCVCEAYRDHVERTRCECYGSFAAINVRGTRAVPHAHRRLAQPGRVPHRRADNDGRPQRQHSDRIRHGGHAQGWRRRAVGVPVSACTLLVRCGCAGGGKGALVSDEVSLTLSTSNTQTLFSEEGGDMVVRRLTPRECERLQGFPSDWTKIPYRGKPADECPDGPRYKAIGNSMAVPVMRFIGERIAMAEAGEIA